MTKLLEQAIKQLRQLPEQMQDSAARAVMLQLEEDPEPGDLEAIAEGRAQRLQDRQRQSLAGNGTDPFQKPPGAVSHAGAERHQTRLPAPARSY